jgi:hypothetical protein
MFNNNLNTLTGIINIKKRNHLGTCDPMDVADLTWVADTWMV